MTATEGRVVHDRTHRVAVYDRREVSIPVEGYPLNFTPKGNRPIEPCRVELTYSVDDETGQVKFVYIRLYGYAADQPRSHGAVRRNLGFGLDGAPDWVRELALRYWPSWRPVPQPQSLLDHLDDVDAVADEPAIGGAS